MLWASLIYDTGIKAISFLYLKNLLRQLTPRL